MGRAIINNQDCDFAPRETILDASRRLGIEIPGLCYDERLKPFGGCRLCIVEVEGTNRLDAACTTLLEDGMIIHTHSGQVESQRRGLLRILAHSCAEPDTPQWELPFYRYLRTYGLEDELNPDHDPRLLDDSHPYIRVDMSQCIHCNRCVAICDQVQGQHVWKVWFRGHATRVRPDSGDSLLASSCVSCGACADTCPSGAISDRTLYTSPPSSGAVWTKTTCPYCGVGCQLNAGVANGRIAQIRPVLDDPVSNGHLCVKGRYAFDFVTSPDRITSPMIREDGQWRSVSWDEAIDYAASRLKASIEKNGPDSVGILGSARATNEDNYITQKFARVVVGTNNVDCCARVCHTPSAAALKSMLGTGAATNSFNDIEKTSTILVCGANSTENHPIVGARIKQAALRGCKLIVIDPRRIELADYASVHLQLKPGTNVPLLNAMAQTIISENIFDAEFLRHRVTSFDELKHFLGTYTPEAASEICGVDADLIRKAARLYASNGPAMMVHGLGVTEHIQGVEGVMCLTNLALLTGNLGKPGTGVNPLRGQNNVQGAAQMGCDPGILTGSVSIGDAFSRFSKVWLAPLPRKAGLNLMQMMDRAIEGKLKALWAIGYDIALTNPHRDETVRALRSLDLLIVQDMFLNETAKELGTVFFPVACGFERDGTFMNGERRIQRIRRIVDAPGQVRQDWEVIARMAEVLGHGHQFNYRSPSNIWDEIRTVWPDAAGINYARLENQGLQWPCVNETDPGTEILHRDVFASGQKAALRSVTYRRTTESSNDEFPFVLITGRVLEQFNAGTMTLRTPNTILHPFDYLDISPEDAAELGIRDRSRVRVVSRHGAATLPARVCKSMRRGELFASFHMPDARLNNVTGSGRDRFVDTPEYKVTAVRVEQTDRDP